MDENRSEDSPDSDDSDDSISGSDESDDSDSESEESYESDISSLLASTVMNDSSGPDSDDLASLSDPGEESQAPLGSDAARGNQTVLDISSDSDIQDRLVAKNKKGVCLPHSTRNRQVLTGIHRRAGRPGPRKR